MRLVESGSVSRGPLSGAGLAVLCVWLLFPLHGSKKKTANIFKADCAFEILLFHI